MIDSEKRIYHHNFAIGNASFVLGLVWTVSVLISCQTWCKSHRRFMLTFNDVLVYWAVGVWISKKILTNEKLLHCWLAAFFFLFAKKLCMTSDVQFLSLVKTIIEFTLWLIKSVNSVQFIDLCAFLQNMQWYWWRKKIWRAFQNICFNCAGAEKSLHGNFLE